MRKRYSTQNCNPIICPTIKKQLKKEFFFLTCFPFCAIGNQSEKNKTQNKTIFSCEKQKESFDKEEGGKKRKRNKFNRRD